MNAPMPLHPRRGVAYRSVCLALGALCVLAVLAGTAGRSGQTVHHRGYVLATAALGYDVQGAGHRAGPDAVSAERAGAQTSAARLTATAGATPGPRRSAPDTVRTRGPPLPA